jgi:ribosomal protein L11 methyltransferase
MPWLALELEVGAAHAEALSDALLELGAQSVSTEDAAAGTGDEAPMYAEPGYPRQPAWRRNRITALVETGCDVPRLLAAAARAAGLAAVPPARANPVGDQDWVRNTQSQFGTLRAGERLWIVPSWCEPPAEDRAIVIRLDPGLAFGTGSHPSTRLVLDWLERNLRGGETVLDYGCGSGILALAAARLGAAEVTAVDLDAQALAACAANARLNGVSLRVAAPAALATGTFDVVVANILAGPLIALAPELAGRAQPGARLALSGILAAQAGEVCAAFAATFDVRVAAAEEGWVLVAGTRR